MLPCPGLALSPGRATQEEKEVVPQYARTITELCKKYNLESVAPRTAYDAEINSKWVAIWNEELHPRRGASGDFKSVAADIILTSQRVVKAADRFIQAHGQRKWVAATMVCCVYHNVADRKGGFVRTHLHITYDPDFATATDLLT